MINEDNLKKIYEGIIDKQELTTKVLNSYGFNSRDLANLINEGVLERTKRGHYSFLAVDNLFSYGNDLWRIKDNARANICFDRCYELDPNNFDLCCELFLRAIKLKDFLKAATLLENFYICDNPNYEKDANFYLFLLSKIILLPPQYRELAKYTQLEDIIDDQLNGDQKLIRVYVIKEKYKCAIGLINDLLAKNGGISTSDYIIVELLKAVVNAKNNFYISLVELTDEKKYEDIVKWFEKIQEQCHLSEQCKYILILVKTILDFQKTGIFPEKRMVPQEGIYVAIACNDFELALSLVEKYAQSTTITPKFNVIFALLSDIVKMKGTKLSTSLEQSVASSTESNEEITEGVVQVLNGNIDIKYDAVTSTIDLTQITFATVVSYLMQQDYTNAFKALKEYLKSLGKSQYEFLIVDLIKLSLLEQDMSFSKPMIALNHISRDNFIFDISEYIQNFYETLAVNKFSEARIYLNIIANSRSLGTICIFIDNLKEILNRSEQILISKKNSEISDKVSALDESEEQITKTEVIVQQEEVPETIETFVLPEEVEGICESRMPEQKNFVETTLKIEATTTVKQNGYEFSQEKLDQLRKYGVLLLKSMNERKSKRILEAVKEMHDVIWFSIGEDSKKRIVLKYNPYISIDLSTVIYDAKAAYRNGDYDTSIELHSKLLNYFSKPKAWIYMHIGLSYMKKHNRLAAIDFLTIATELSKIEQSDYDFTELIAKLKDGEIDAGTVKPNVKMSVDDFVSDVNDYYGVDNMSEFADLVISGISPRDAGKALGLSEEQESLATLVLVREFYLQEDYLIGDKYLKIVEKNKNKSKFVVRLLEELKRNKKFYKNRVDENYKPFTFKPVR